MGENGRPRLNGNSPVEKPELVNFFSYGNLDGFYTELSGIREQMLAEGDCYRLRAVSGTELREDCADMIVDTVLPDAELARHVMVG